MGEYLFCRSVRNCGIRIGIRPWQIRRIKCFSLPIKLSSWSVSQCIHFDSRAVSQLRYDWSMSGVWRVVGAAVFAALASGVMPAQIAPVQLTIGPARLIRGGTAILDISLQIQEGYFVPAQTRGSLKGAWVQALPPWL